MEQSTTSNKSETTNLSLVNYKDDEKLMSESLYRNLHVLCRFHEPSAEFLLHFQPHMFIKPNQKAFLVVIHFIFNCVDSTECKRMFRWPIFDKTGETVFRNAALNYMNHLNVTHQLGLETLKLSNIHIPGGLKFIKIIHKFTYLAMKLELNKPEHGPLPDAQNIPDGDDMYMKLEQYVERGMDYATRLEAQSEKLSKRIGEMQAMMDSCLDVTTESKAHKVCWKCLQKKWKEHLDCVVGDDVAPQLEVVNLLSKNTVQLNELLTKLFVDKKENIVEYDRHQLIAAQKCLKKVYPDFVQEIDGITEGNTINFANLLKVFSLMLPNMTNKLKAIEDMNTNAIEYELNQIDECAGLATKYYDAFNECKDLIQSFKEKEIENYLHFCHNNFNLPFKLLGTPIVARQLQVNGMRNRFGLIDESTKRTQLFKKPAVRRGNKKNAFQTSSCSTLGGYKATSSESLQLLAKPKSRSNTSMSFLNMSNMGKFSTPKLSSSTSINRLNLQPEIKFSSSFPMTPIFAKKVTETTSIVSPNGISVVRKVEKRSVMHMRSPTRHFYVNNVSPELATVIEASAERIMSEQRMNQIDTVANGIHMEMLNENVKDINIGTPGHSSSLQTVEDGVEFINDISDTVLNDVLSE